MTTLSNDQLSILTIELNVARTIDFHSSLTLCVCSLVFAKSCYLAFTAHNITGKSILCIEKADLKEMGVLDMGRRLEIFQMLKELKSKKQFDEASTTSKGVC